MTHTLHCDCPDPATPTCEEIGHRALTSYTFNQTFAEGYAYAKGDSPQSARRFGLWALPGDEFDPYAGDLHAWVAVRYLEWVYEA